MKTGVHLRLSFRGGAGASRPGESPAVACLRVAMASGMPAAQAENLGETLIPVINRLQDIFSQACPSVRLPI